MVNMRKTTSPSSPTKVKVKTERDVDTSPPSAPPVPVPPPALPPTTSSFPHPPHAVVGVGANNERRPSPPSVAEHKPITLSKLMRARAQRQEFYCKGTGVFSFDLELHRQSLGVQKEENSRKNHDHSEVKMPESPVDQALTKSSSQPNALAGPNLSAHPRSHSTSSSTGSIVNGLNSPHSMNGTPSPPSGLGGGAVSAIQGIPANQEVPAACGARQLSKLKRFLTTLQQFGSDISPEIGERVRGLVMGLVNNALTVEEFHNKLQEATNFPLRPFVIPFLKTNLPLLQRELMHCARLAKLSPQQYYLQHEHQLLEPKTSDPNEHLMEVSENGKRKTPEERMMTRPKENGSSGGERLGEGPHPKRHCSMGSPTHPTSAAYPPLNHYPPGLSAAHHAAFRVEELGSGQVSGSGRDSARDLREMREMREMRERFERERERDRHTPHAFPPFREVYPDPMLFEDRVEDDWKHVETMLQCIIGMVEKTKRALAVLHQRSIQDREELAHWNRRQSGSGGGEPGSKKRTDEMMAQTLRQTEDRVTEVKRRAEEAVNEVKRQAVSELQKAVAAAERKANEMVSAERTKLDRAILEARQQASEEAALLLNHQEDSSESCWNCGRKANETCSGCNTARYCGAFCQHKDWENHHRMCSQYATPSSSSSSQPPQGFPSSSSVPLSQPPSTTSVISPSPGAHRSVTPVVVTTAAAAATATPGVLPPSAVTPTSAASPTGSHHSSTSNRSGSPASAPSAVAVSQES